MRIFGYRQAKNESFSFPLCSCSECLNYRCDNKGKNESLYCKSCFTKKEIDDFYALLNEPKMDKENMLILEGNKFCNYSLEELKKYFEEIKPFYINSHFEIKNYELKNVLAYYVKHYSNGMKKMEYDLLLAIAMKSM